MTVEQNRPKDQAKPEVISFFDFTPEHIASLDRWEVKEVESNRWFFYFKDLTEEDRSNAEREDRTPFYYGFEVNKKVDIHGRPTGNTVNFSYNQPYGDGRSSIFDPKSFTVIEVGDDSRKTSAVRFDRWLGSWLEIRNDGVVWGHPDRQMIRPH